MGAPTEISRRHMLAMSAAGGLAAATRSGARAQAPGAKRIEQFDPALEKIISTPGVYFIRLLALMSLNSR
jgi:hypothetical protein